MIAKHLPVVVLALVATLASGCDNKPAASASSTASAAATGTATAAATAAPTAAPKGGARVEAVAVDDKGFTPSKIEVKKGQKLTLRFKRTSESTCATKVVFPEIKLEKELPMNKVVDVEVPTDEARTLAFQCGMGMYKSSVVVN